MEQIYTPKQDYKVLVRCFTYNQGKYIEDALNGFAMQKTDFPFVCLVMDDCSTDGEQEVTKEWMERECDMEKAEYIDLDLSNVILVPHKTNESCTFAFYLLKQNLYGTGKKMPLVTPWREHCEYEAMCEGDDYWVAEDKLQKQVDILNKNQNISMVISDGYTDTALRSFSPRIQPYESFSTGIVGMHTLLRSTGGLVPTASMCYRCLFIEMPPFFKQAPVGDKPLRMWYALKGDIYYIDEPQVFYRISAESSFSKKVTSNHSYAERIYKGFCQFLDSYDKYTNYEFSEDIQYMKDKEEFFYYQRIKSSNLFKCNYFRNPDNKLSIRKKIKLFAYINFPRLYTALSNTINRRW